MATVTMKELLEAGVHFGHLTRKWNPKMKRYIFGQRNGIHIIDLKHTLRSFKKASDFIAEVSSHGNKVLFVGTKRQAQEAIREAAESVSMPYVTERWLGGTLTNFRTIQTRIQRLKELNRLETDESREGSLTKKERLILMKEKEKLHRMLSGIVDLGRLPGALFVIDIRKEKNCVREAKKLGIPIVAVVDTNCDPDDVTYPIPGNDDAVRAIHLFSNRVANAVQEGKDLYQAQEKAKAEQEAMAEKIARDMGKVEEEKAAPPKRHVVKKVVAKKPASPAKPEAASPSHKPAPVKAAPEKPAPAKKAEEKKTEAAPPVKKAPKAIAEPKAAPKKAPEEEPKAEKKPAKKAAPKKAPEEEPKAEKKPAKKAAPKKAPGEEPKAEKKSAKKAAPKKDAEEAPTAPAKKKPAKKAVAKKDKAASAPAEKKAAKKAPAKKAPAKKAPAKKKSADVEEASGTEKKTTKGATTRKKAAAEDAAKPEE